MIKSQIFISRWTARGILWEKGGTATARIPPPRAPRGHASPLLAHFIPLHFVRGVSRISRISETFLDLQIFNFLTFLTLKLIQSFENYLL